jgi:mannose-6-phosphate isomerase-like protein (cupin superfamily)
VFIDWKNPGRIVLTMISVQTGSYLGEDDIIHYVDGCGRTEPIAA